MKEFCYGYKKAATDAIIKEAGISKGLLYHYFGAKEQLYGFLVRYASDLVQKDYFDMMNRGHQDILEVFWQVALLKKDISNQYPYLYDFLNSLHVHRSDAVNMEITSVFEEEQRAAYEELYNQCDKSLFREDIDHKKAIDIISLTLDSLFDDGEAKAISAGGWDDENYENFLELLRGYLDVFRVCFYKKQD
jgi:AcrR family transcriptional regulator